MAPSAQLLWMRRRMPLWALLLLSAWAGSPVSRAAALPFSARTTALVQAICQSAFLAEMQRLGRVPPAGMADYACDCVTRRLAAGSGIDQARNFCRQQTALRYPL